jgi:hypothetical protein
MNIEISQVDAALTGDGTAHGNFGIAATTGLYPGAFGQLYDIQTPQNTVMVQITDIPDATHVNVRIAAQAAVGSGSSAQTLTQNLKPNYGHSDISVFTVAHGSRFCQNAQIVRVEPQAQAAPLL